MSKCKYCDFENDDDALFCGGCGHKIEDKESKIPVIPKSAVPNIPSTGNLDAEKETKSEGEQSTLDVSNTSTEEDPTMVDAQNTIDSNVPKTQKSQRSILIVVLVLIIIFGAGCGGLIAFQNSKHQAEIAALKAEQKQKENESKKKVEAAKKEAAATKKSSDSDKDQSNDSSKPSAGTYVADYDMKERADASLSAEQVGHIKKGDSLDIVEVVDNGDGSYWGKLSNGHYVCVKDNEYQYLS